MFGRKSVEDLLKAFNSLSEEDKAKFLNGVQPVAETKEQVAEETSEDASAVEESQEEQTEADQEENVVEHEQETVETMEKSVEVQPESVENDVVEETQSTPEPEQEAEGPEVKQNKEEVDQAQTARFEAIESEIKELREMFLKFVDAAENKDFGLSPQAPESAGEDENRYSAVMRGYAGGNAKKYL